MQDLVLIRPSVEDDMASVLELIKELAIYENAEKEVTNTVEQLRKDGFGESKVFDCLVAEIDQNIVGFALFYTSYSTWKGSCLYLEDFLVTEKKRGQGIGQKLFDAVYDIAKARKVKRFEWQVLEWNKPAINFYNKYKAELDSEWLNGKIFLD